MTFDERAIDEEIHQTAVDHGWWEPQCEHPKPETLGHLSLVYWCNLCGAVSGDDGKTWSLPKLAQERNTGEVFMLFVTEIAEAYEEIRKGLSPRLIYTDGVGSREDGGLTLEESLARGDKPEGVPVELADLDIRVRDYCMANGIPLSYARRIKMDYNHNRPYRHGGKLS